MNRLSLPVWLVLVIAAGFCMFQIKFAVQELEHQLGQTNRDIARAQEQVRVLKAEWSYLNEPNRLADLNRRHLGLAPVAAKQMENVAVLPQRLDVALPSPQFQPKPATEETTTIASSLEWSTGMADLDATQAATPAFASLAPSEFVPVSFQPDHQIANGEDAIEISTAPTQAAPAAPLDPTAGSEDISASTAAATRAATGPLVSPSDDPLGALIAATAAEEQQ
jgi:hypothetical protein